MKLAIKRLACLRLEFNWCIIQFNMVLLLFLSWRHGLSVDDTEDGEDNDEEEKLPANKLVQRSLEHRRLSELCL